jgi:uncharacterized membrane protein YccC
VTRAGQGAARDLVVPDWLAEVVRLRRVPVPWPSMIRAAVAICGPLTVGIGVGQRAPGLLVAMGGLLGTVVDRGGPYLARIRRVGSAAVFGGAGLAIGSVIHGRGWLAVVALVAVAGVSAVLSAVGDVGSVTGLQLLIYTSLGLGPVGMLRPWWHTALAFVAGTVWALGLTVPGWLFSPRAAEQRSVADVYQALAAELAAVGTPGFTAARRELTAAFNTAYDTLLAARSAAAGRDRRMARLMALLNQAHPIAEAAAALHQEGNRPPPGVAAAARVIAGMVRGSRVPVTALGGSRVPVTDLGAAGGSPGAALLTSALAEAARVAAGTVAAPAAAPAGRPPLRDRVGLALARVTSPLSRTFGLRLMASTGVAGVLTEVLPLQRSYWVVLTVAIVLKPDFGSVFIRAVQRGAGTIAGAVLGAVILAAVPYGPWLLIPFGILAALLPYGQSRNYGLFATFLTPLVVVLIDLMAATGWRLAADRLLDTVLGCLVVLTVGYAAWPMSWQAHLPGQFARTIRDVCRYTEEALAGVPQADGATAAGAPPPGRAQIPPRSQLRRLAYRSLSDLRAEFQRAMSEPAPVGRRAAGWWPALVGLEEVVDAVTAVAVAIAAGGRVPDPAAVRQVTAALSAVADRVERGTGEPVPAPPPPVELPLDRELAPVTGALRSVLSVLADGTGVRDSARDSHAGPATAATAEPADRDCDHPDHPASAGQ